MIAGFTWYQVAWFFLSYSFLGWVMESCFVSFQQKHWVNRGFLTGPFCPIYGVGMCTIILALTPVAGNYAALFFGGMVLASLIEYITSAIMEKLFNTRWWDYSTHKFNINGRICLDTSLAWGFLSIFVIKVLHPPIQGMVDKIPVLTGRILLSVFGLYFLADLAVAAVSALGLSRKLKSFAELKLELETAYEKSRLSENVEWLKLRFEDSAVHERISALAEQIQEASEDGSERLRQRLEDWKERYRKLNKKESFFERRLHRAFPKLRPIKLSKTAKEMKEEMEKNDTEE